MTQEQKPEGQQSEHILAELHDVKARAGIGSQIMLPWSKSFSMCKSNIFVRLGRSIITASGIFLGIAFLSSVLASNSLKAAKALMSAQEMTAVGGDDPTETATRFVWLVAMSLLVATIGIVNSMLMSVTERYKEIGTMKCLGALDSFIVRLFLLESSLLGMLGAIMGVLVGAGVMILFYVIRDGWVILSNAQPVSGMPLWLALIINIPIGGILSVLAAIYPAWRAAKMPPAAALRSEF